MNGAQTLRVFRFGFMLGRQDFAIFWRNWRVWIVAWILRTTTSATMWVLLGKVLGSREALVYLLIGNGVIAGTLATGWVVPSSTWDRLQGTYPMLVVSPAGLRPSVTGRTFIWLLNGIATSLTTFAVLILLFRLPLSMPNALFVPVAIGIICGSSYGFALFLGAFVIRAPRVRNIVHNVATIAMTAFCGVSVPIAFWPHWLGAVVTFMPVTHGLVAVRLLLARGPAAEIVRGLSLEVVVGLGWLFLGLLVMNRMADAGRADGSIDWSGA